MASMCNCSAWCMIARRVSKPNICRLRILHCLCQHGCEPEIFMFLRLPCVCIHLECGQRSRCTHTMRARMCVSVVVCVARKLHPCPSYSGRRDRNNSVHWRSLYRGGGGDIEICISVYFHERHMTSHKTGLCSKVLCKFLLHALYEFPYCPCLCRRANLLLSGGSSGEQQTKRGMGRLRHASPIETMQQNATGQQN